MKLVVTAGNLTLVESNVGKEPGEVHVRYTMPWPLRWMPVGVDVKINTAAYTAAISVMM